MNVPALLAQMAVETNLPIVADVSNPGVQNKTFNSWLWHRHCNLKLDSANGSHITVIEYILVHVAQESGGR